jgi:hypothetical protein
LDIRFTPAVIVLEAAGGFRDELRLTFIAACHAAGTQQNGLQNPGGRFFAAT